MGWKGTVRSIGAAVRAAERDAKRRQRELERQQKQYEKMQELEQAAYEVEVYENYIDIIQSIHKERSYPIDWNKVASTKQPTEPQRSDDNESQARQSLESYKPGLFDRLFKRGEKKRLSLSQEIDEAKNKDEVSYRANVSKWEEDIEKWKENVTMAKALLNGSAEAKIEVIEKLQPFSEISNLGSSLSIYVHGNGLVEATINVHGTEIIPSETKSLLKSGKLSIKSTPKGKFNEMYQDYVCGCALRIGNELLAIIPDNLVIVTAVDELLNSQTGHLEEVPILSVAISRGTVGRLNLETIDPSDSMDNFKHNMSFKKTKGFERVERIDPDGLSGA